MSLAIDTLWERIYALEANWPSPESFPQVAHLKADIDALSPDSPERAMLAAYLAYMFPCDTTASVDIESELKFVLERDPDNLTACQYLGHWYYDNGKYAEARCMFEQIDPCDYIRAGQEWRALKIQELRLAANLHCGRLKGSREELDRLLQQFRNISADNLAVPLELVTVLREHYQQCAAEWGRDAMRAVGCELRDIVDAIAGPATLSQEIADLQSDIQY